MIPGVLPNSLDHRCGVLAGHRREAEVDQGYVIGPSGRVAAVLGNTVDRIET